MDKEEKREKRNEEEVEKEERGEEGSGEERGKREGGAEKREGRGRHIRIGQGSSPEGLGLRQKQCSVIRLRTRFPSETLTPVPYTERERERERGRKEGRRERMRKYIISLSLSLFILLSLPHSLSHLSPYISATPTQSDKTLEAKSSSVNSSELKVLNSKPD